MLSCHYIQKGLFFPSPPMPIASLVSLLSSSLSRALSLFPALAGRLSTLPDGRILISCNDAGVEFAYATADSLTLPDLLAPSSDVPPAVKSLFPLDGAISFHGHFRPRVAVRHAGSEATAAGGDDDVPDGGELPAPGRATAAEAETAAAATKSRRLTILLRSQKLELFRPFLTDIE
ncbi:hypothetical protein BHE74_00013149 [Ensete ventricosum]|nr:hypothetical protein BHE74_00013149 [Ensete ventricosum]